MKKLFVFLFTITLIACNNNASGTTTAENWKESKWKYNCGD